MTYSIVTSRTLEYRAPGRLDEETVDDVRDTHLANPWVNDAKDSRAESAREQIVRAAARQFAVRPYHLVSLDDILAEAEVTKGAMYFHFRSKYALAVTLIEMYTELAHNTVREQLGLHRSALETLIDISYLMAVLDVTHDTARAGIHLLEAVGRTDNLQADRMADWVASFGDIAGRAIDEGDIVAGSDPVAISRVLVSLYTGIRQTTAFDDAGTSLAAVESSWILVMPGFVDPGRIGYFTQFVRRRTRVALAKVSR
ncbi:TetR/AcrR family transcriptional regulator [soil metagenome]